MSANYTRDNNRTYRIENVSVPHVWPELILVYHSLEYCGVGHFNSAAII
ncbi:hypothetical protein THOE12_20119 [Vibrio rotiferianus]|nr:hypothetical protein THOE12_20119 [Vibrio rotiferianus]